MSWRCGSTPRMSGSPPRPASSSAGSSDDRTRHPATWGARRPGAASPTRAIDKSAVDLIVVACATPDQSQPAVACMVQEKLGVGRPAVPRLRRELRLRRLRLRPQRRAEHDAHRPHAVPPRAGDRHRRLLEDPQLARSADLRLLRRRRRRGAAVAVRSGDDGRIRLPPGERRARQPPHRGAGRRHPDADQPGGAREAPQHLRHERPQGLGLRRRHRPRVDPLAAGRARPDARPIST